MAGVESFRVFLEGLPQGSQVDEAWGLVNSMD